MTTPALATEPTEPAVQTVRRYRIDHQTRFSYSAPVALDQMVIRLQPRTSYDQRLVEFAITTDPQPARHTYCFDLHGNIRHWFWFDKSHPHLTITTASVVDCLCVNPFDFIIVDEGVQSVPARYAEPVGSASRHYRERPSPHPAVDALAREIIRQSEGQTITFLWSLAQHIQSNITHIVRDTGDPWTPTQTLERGEGACRDSAVLFIDACRAAGLAARFVSGYAWDALNQDRRELHAWAEVYLPGAGWRGYDPTVGLAVSNRHVAVASSPSASYAAPTAGTFTGPRVASELTFDIQMTTEELHSESASEGATYVWP